MKRFIFFVFISLFFFSFSYAQTGPGGIGNSSGSGSQPKLVFWLDATQLGLSGGDDILNWNDVSGNGWNFSTTAALSPVFTTGGPNGNSYANFSRTNNRIVLNPFDDMPDREVTAFVIYRTTDSGDGLLSYAVSGSDNEFLVFNNSSIRSYIDGSENNSGVAMNSGNWQIYGLRWRSSNGQLTLTRNSSQIHSTTHRTGSVLTKGGSFAIGGEQDGVDAGYTNGQAFSGDIAEVLMYDGFLSEAQRIILENHLSSKYDLSLSANDFYAGDSPGNGNFDLEVIGIGRAAGTEHLESRSSGLVLLADGTLDSDNEFIIAGHNSPSNATTNSDLPGSVEERWTRTWYIDKTGTLGATVAFDIAEGISGLFPADNGDYVLLRWNGASFSIVTTSGTSITGNEIRFVVSDANLTDGIYTLGTQDATASPLTGIANRIWYSYQSGDWSDPAVWTLDGSVTPTYNNPGGTIPSPIDDVVITNGRTVLADFDGISASSLQVIGTLDVSSAINTSFADISGNGIIQLSGSPSQTDNFPSGDASGFANPATGGTVIYYGAGLSIDQPHTFNNIIINLNGTGNVASLEENLSANGHLEIERGILRINDNTNGRNLSVAVNGDLLIQNQGSLITGTGNSRHELNLSGDLINNGGTLALTNRTAPNYNNEATDGITDANFINTSEDQEIICNGPSRFYRIEINKGDDATYILDIYASSASNFSIFGPADYSHGSTPQLTVNDNALGLLRGTVRINSNVNIPVLNNGGNYNISEGARLWVNGGSATKPSGTAIVIYGTIQLSDGTIDAPVNSGLTTRDNGDIIVSGGVMTVRQIRTSVQGPENIGGYTQSGGTVNVTGGGYNNDYYVFSLTYPGNTFNMSGGTLQVSGVSGSGPAGRQGGIFINSDEGNFSVTGGTVIMENTTNQNFKVSSRVPLWNVVMRSTSGSSTQIELDEGTSGDNQPGEFETITSPKLRVLNNLTIENGVEFDHNGYDVEIGGNFVIEAGGDYLYDNGKRNTTTINGTTNSLLAFYNRSGGTNDEQRFWNLVIDKPSDRVVTLESGKSNRNGNNNNLLRIDGDSFKLLSGTLDNGTHSVRMYTDSLVNFQRLGVYNPANANPDATSNGNNDLIKFRPDPFILITADTSVFGNVRLNSGGAVVTLVSDVLIERLDFKHGRMDLQANNLKINNLDVQLNGSETRTDEDGDGNFSVEDMFIMNGNASDGGLSLYIPAGGANPGFIDMSGAGNTTSNPTVYFFPVGTGTTGSDADSEYTPANIRLLSAADDGYITVKVVKGKLPTAGPYPLGNDISDRYWIVDYEGFTTVPVVERMWFRSVERDDPNGGAVGFPGNYVPGYVLDDDPFTRNSEISGAAPSTSGFDVSNARNIRIFFWGNTGSGNPAGGFNLINAAYTAGDPSKFVGAPTVFYNRNNGRRNWNDAAKWTENADGSDDGVNTIPGTGDVVVLRNYGQGNQNGWVNLNIDIEIARLIYDNSFGGWRPRLWITRNNALANLGIVSGTGEVYVEHTIAQQPDFTGSDFGLFSDEENSFFVFRADANSPNPIPLPVNIPVYPNLRIEGGNGAFNQRITQNTIPITINKDMWIDWGGTFSAADDIYIKGRLRVGQGGGARGLFEIFDNKQITVDIDGDLEITNNVGDPRFTVRNTSLNSLEHRILVGGNLTVEAGILDLYNGTGTNNNAILIFDGTGDASFVRSGGSLPDLWRIGINKAGGRNDVVDLQTNFNLNSPSDTADKPVLLTSGVFRFNNSALDIMLTSLGNFTIPGPSGLQISQGIARVSGDNSGIILDGLIQIDGGTLDMDESGNGNNFIEYSSSGDALISVSSGNLLVGSQLRPITTAETGILKYRQTGGDVRLGINAAPQNNRGILQIYNAGSEFTYTGGTLSISRHQNAPAVAALFLDPASADIQAPITIFDADTPAGQTDFRINSTVPLADLVIQDNNSPTARLFINPLTISGDLTIASNATLDSDGLTLELNGNMTINGTYVPDGNTTIFDADAAQSISGSGSNEFFKLQKSGTGTLNVDRAILVNEDLEIFEGIVDDNGNTIRVSGNVLNDGIHQSTGSSEGIVFSGSSQQLLTRSGAGTGTFGAVTIDNPSGVVIPDGNGYNFTITTNLRLSSGVFNIGGSLLTIDEQADIIPVNPFSVTNMIQTNSSFTDNGVRKNFTANYTNDFIFPVGELLYTPVIIDLSGGSNTIGTSAGSITIRPSAEFHPSINDGVDFFATGDINNVLQYYWIMEASNLNGFTSQVQFWYDQSDVRTDEPGYNETDYIAARILSNGNPTNAVNKFTTAEVEETLNQVIFDFSGVSSNGVSGDYFAGINEAIPDNVTTYTSLVNGNVEDPIYDEVVPGGGAPNGAILRVASGTTVTFNIDGVNLYRTEIEAGGVLEIDETTQHRLGIVTGSGVLRIVSNSNNANLPAGFYVDFFDCSGGGLEYSGTGSYSIMSGITAVRSLSVVGSGNRSIANNDINICEDLTVDGPTVAGNSQNRISVGNDFIMESGVFNAPTGTNGVVSINRNLDINGGTFNGANSSGRTAVDGNATINGGTLNIGGLTYNFRLRGNLSRTSGNFSGGTGNAEFIFDGSSLQSISGTFNGTNAFRRFRINNGSDVRLIDDITVEDILFLDDGNVLTNGQTFLLTQTASVSPATGRSNSFVNGKLLKEMNSGESFIFPIGKGAFWRYASVLNTSSGPATWEAEYFAASPLTHPDVDNLVSTDPEVIGVAQGEYWVISDGNLAATGRTATIGLSWGIESDVAALSSDREKLRVLIWNDGANGWDNLGGINFASGHSQSRGYFTSSTAASFSEHVFTLGTTDAANPLPVTLDYFEGRVENGNNVLEWRTRSELNNDYFELQRSSNGETFETIATVNGAGTTSTIQNYEFTDTNPPAGINYYRLKQVDFDGTVAFADNIVRLDNRMERIFLNMTLYPNPTTDDNINIIVQENLSGQDAYLEIMDLSGRKLYQEILDSETLNQNDHHHTIRTRLPQGVYVVILRMGLLNTSKRLIIK